jgi:hypothetical protein
MGYPFVVSAINYNNAVNERISHGKGGISDLPGIFGPAKSKSGNSPSIDIPTKATTPKNGFSQAQTKWMALSPGRWPPGWQPILFNQHQKTIETLEFGVWRLFSEKKIFASKNTIGWLIAFPPPLFYAQMT